MKTETKQTPIETIKTISAIVSAYWLTHHSTGGDDMAMCNVIKTICEKAIWSVEGK